MPDDIVSELNQLFYPKNIAILGASNSLKIGTVTLLTIMGGGFGGDIYPIHPKDDNIVGLKAYRKLQDVPAKIDLGIISIPASKVPQAMEDCVEAGVKTCVIITAGFSETGAEGKRLEREVVSIARKGGIRFVGPNCMGIANTSIDLHALMNMAIARPGRVSVVSQSGTLGTMAMVTASSEGVGFNKFVSSGNEADLRMEDFLEYFAQDEGTKVVFAFIEGVREGRRFFEISKKLTEEKPFVVLKGGTTGAGAKAAGSHTGALAGTEKIYDVAFRQAGITRAADEREMIDLIKSFEMLPLPKSKKIAILTAGGGEGVLMADACEKAGLEVQDLPKPVIEELNKLLPSFWSHKNPIDVTASGISSDAWGMGYGGVEKCAEVLLESPEVDNLLFLAPIFPSVLSREIRPRVKLNFIADFLSMENVIGWEKIQAQNMVRLKEKYKKSLVAINMAQTRAESVKILEEEGIPVFNTPNQAATVLSKMWRYKRYLDKTSSPK